MASPQILSPKLIEGMILAALNRADQETTVVDELVRTLDVSAKEQSYVAVGSPPNMKRWTGDRTSGELNVNEFTVANLPYETSVKIHLRDMMYDATGMLNMRVGELSEAYRKHRIQLIVDLINDGAKSTARGYDNLSFFNDAHITPGAAYQTAQDNKLTVPVSSLKDGRTNTGVTKDNITPNLFMLAVEQGRTALQGFRGDTGDPINSTSSSFLVVAPSKYGSQVNAVNRALVNSDQITAGMSGTDFRAIVLPQLNVADTFYMFITGEATRPFGYQIGQRPVLRSQAAGSAIEFSEKAHLYGIDYEGAAFYLAWPKAVSITLT